MENTITQKEDVRVKRKSQVIETAKRYMKNKLAVLGLLIFLVILFFALFAGKFGTYEECVAIDIVNKLKTPSSEHWFGTDTYGRDLFLRCIYGARISLIIGIVASLLSLLVGGLLGMTAAYYGGNYDNITSLGHRKCRGVCCSWRTDVFLVWRLAIYISCCCSGSYSANHFISKNC